LDGVYASTPFKGGVNTVDDAHWAESNNYKKANQKTTVNL